MGQLLKKQPAQSPAQKGPGVPPQGQHPQQDALADVQQAPTQVLLEPPVAVPVVHAYQAAFPLIKGPVAAHHVLMDRPLRMPLKPPAANLAKFAKKVNYLPLFLCVSETNSHLVL